VPIEYGSRSLGQLIQESRAAQLVLPNFQREFVWSSDDQRSVATSVLLEIPSGSILLIKGQADEFASRLIGRRESFEPPDLKSTCEFVLDGQQRLSSLHQTLSDPFADDWKTYFDSTYFALRSRWCLRVVPKEDDDPDFFGWHELRFQGLPTEPDLVKEAFVVHRILKTRHLDRWYHPAFYSSLGRQERILRIAQYASSEGQVPLWGVLNGVGDDSLTQYTLKLIAEARRQQLDAKVKDSTLDASVRDSLRLPGEKSVDKALLLDRLRDRQAEWVQAVASMLGEAGKFRFSTIQLTSDEVSKAIVIFEAINRGGSPLTTFDLVAARLARVTPTEMLPEMIVNRLDHFKPKIPVALRTNVVDAPQWSVGTAGIGIKNGSLTPVFKNHFLQALALIDLRKRARDAGKKDHRFVVEDLKQGRVLALTPESVQEWWDDATDAILEAWRFIQVRCGVASEGSLRNKLILLPVAAALADGKVPKSAKTYDQIEYFYWCSVLTSTYTERQNENCVNDIDALGAWLRGERGNPFKARESIVFNDIGYSDKATLLRMDEDASIGADVGMYLPQFVCAQGGRDLIEDRPLVPWQDSLEDHHLIPLFSATNVGQSSREIRKGNDQRARLLNSPINRCLILAETNRAIGGRAVEQYMKEVKPQVRASIHLPPDDGFYLRDDEDFDSYVRRVLGWRFDQLRTSAMSHLTKLRGSN
jgi:hypothetical protein